MNFADKILAKRYAAAYMAEAGGSPEKAGKLASALLDCRAALSGARGYLENPLIPQSIKRAIIKEKLPADSSARRFISVLLSARRFNLLDAAARECGAELDRLRGVARAEVRTARPLDEHMKNALKRQLGRMTGKTVELQDRQEESLIGGVEITIGDMFIEASVRGRLNRLKAELSK